jgi:hypothetical protein
MAGRTSGDIVTRNPVSISEASNTVFKTLPAELAVSQEGCWRKIAITLIVKAAALSEVNECNRLLTTTGRAPTKSLYCLASGL